MLLESIGATPFVYRDFEPYVAKGLILARVASAQRDHYRLLTETGELDAEPSGALWYRTTSPAAMPVVGDWAAVRVVGEEAVVEAVLPRHTLFSRRAAGRREEEQPIAANIDLVFLVCGLDGDFNLRRVERYLALTAASGADAVIVLNKSDLCGDLDARMAKTRSIAGGAPIVAATTLRVEGLDSLRAYVGAGITVALLGSSGAGKSSIVNGLIGEQRLRTNEVRAHDSRGRHTTTHRELIPLPEGGALIDTPGMRELQLWVSEETVEAVFDEISNLATRCRFRDCSHTTEQGCAVLDALEAGTLDPERLASFRKLTAEARHHEAMTNPLAALERKRKWKAIHKANRNLYRDRL